MPRATPMSADDRRAMIIEATDPLLREHGRAVSTRQIAQAAGIAEGTIFRVFDSKEALIDAVLERALSSEVTLQELRRIDPEQDLREVMIGIARVLQQRMIDSFTLIRALGPPKDPKEEDRRQMRDRMIADAQVLSEAIGELIGGRADRLLVDVDTATYLLRSIVFALSHPMVAWVHGTAPHEKTDPAAIVDMLLYGIDSTGPPGHRCDLAESLRPLSILPTTHPCP